MVGATPSGGTTPGQPAGDTTPPATRVFVPARQRLAAALAHGLRVSVRLDEPALLRARAATGAHAAAAAGVRAQAGETTLRLRFSAAARRRLRGHRAIRLNVTVAARDAAGNVSRARRSLTLRP